MLIFLDIQNNSAHRIRPHQPVRYPTDLISLHMAFVSSRRTRYQNTDRHSDRKGYSTHKAKDMTSWRCQQPVRQQRQPHQQRQSRQVDMFSRLHNEVKKMWNENLTVRREQGHDGRQIKKGPIPFAHWITRRADQLDYSEWECLTQNFEINQEPENIRITRSSNPEKVWIHQASRTVLPNPASHDPKHRDLEPQDISTVFALHMLAKSDHPDVPMAFQHLEEEYTRREGESWPLGRMVNVVNGRNGYTVLCRAAYFLNYKLLGILLSRGADAEFRNKHGETLDQVLEQGIRDAENTHGKLAVQDNVEQTRAQLRYWRERQQRLRREAEEPVQSQPKKWVPLRVRKANSATKISSLVRGFLARQKLDYRPLVKPSTSPAGGGGGGGGGGGCVDSNHFGPSLVEFEDFSWGFLDTPSSPSSPCGSPGPESEMVPDSWDL